MHARQKSGDMSIGLQLTRAASAVVCTTLAACSSKPLLAYSTDTPPLVLVSAAGAAVIDQRARFREINCPTPDRARTH
jgi:hypothetical protein